VLFGFIVRIEDEVEKSVLNVKVGVVEVRLEVSDVNVLDEDIELVVFAIEVLAGCSVRVSDDVEKSVLDVKVGVVDTRLKVVEVDVLDNHLELLVFVQFFEVMMSY
jgi:hypothetical protein